MNSIQHIAKFLSARCGKSLLGIFVLSSLAAVAESFGLLIFMPFFVQMFDTQSSEDKVGGEDSFNSYFSWIFDSRLIPDELLLLSILFFFLLKALLVFRATHLISKTKSRVMSDFRLDLVSLVFGARYDHVSRLDVGFLTSLLNDRINQVGLFFVCILQFATQLGLASVYLIVTLILSPAAATLGGICGVVLFIGYRATNKRLGVKSNQIAAYSGRLGTKLTEVIGALEYLFNSGLQHLAVSRTAGVINALKDMQISMAKTQNLVDAAREPIIVTVFLIILFVATQALNLVFSEIAVILVLFYRLLQSLIGLQGGWTGVLEHLGAINQLQAVFFELRENQSKMMEFEKINEGCEKIVGKDISVYSADNKTYRLVDCSFEIDTTLTTVILGPSGSGKSTLLKLLTGVIEPTSGRLDFIGLDGKKMSPESRVGNIGFLPQAPIIFNDTIRNNLVVFQQDCPTDEDLLKMLDRVGLSNWIDSLEGGLDTFIGSIDAGLSGGQKQRLAIARELLKKPKFLILDEPLTGLDIETAKRIISTLDALRADMGFLITTHHDQVIDLCENVGVLDQGELLFFGDKATYRKHRHEK